MQDQSIFFPVEERDVFAAGVIHAPTHKAIVRTDTKEVLGIHSQKYKLVKHSDFFPRVEDLIHDTLDTTGMQVTSSADKSGARVLRTYLLPAHQVDIVDGDKIALQLRLANSLDASFSFGMQTGALRFACWNGLVSGAVINNVKRKHTNGLDLDYMLNTLTHALQNFDDEGNLWKQWVNTKVTSEQATAIFERVATSKKMLSGLESMWAIERGKIGPTAWGIFQTLTAWSTHTKSKANQATSLVQREQRVKAVLPELTRLAA